MNLIAAKDADSYMLRLPPGLRDRVRKRATDNGRSMNTEIVAAIEQWLKDERSVLERLERLEKAMGWRP